MEVIKITNQEDGSAIVDFKMTEKEINIFVEYAFIDILRKYLETIKDEDKRECYKCYEEISKETIVNFPDTEICGNCIND